MATKKKKTTEKEEAPKRPKKLVVEEVAEKEEVKKETSVEEKTPEKENKGEGVEEKKEEVKKEGEPKEIEESKEKETLEKSGEVSAKKVLLIAIPIAIFTGLLSGGIFYYVNSNKGESASATPTPIVEETATPEPTPTLERSDLTVQVLNGSGISGKAGEVEDFLEELGYEDVATGNAATYDFEEMEISIKEESEDYLDMLTEDLEDEYDLATESSTLDEDSDYDVVITVGTS